MIADELKEYIQIREKFEYKKFFSHFLHLLEGVQHDQVGSVLACGLEGLRFKSQHYGQFSDQTLLSFIVVWAAELEDH